LPDIADDWLKMCFSMDSSEITAEGFKSIYNKMVFVIVLEEIAYLFRL